MSDWRTRAQPVNTQLPVAQGGYIDDIGIVPMDANGLDAAMGNPVDWRSRAVAVQPVVNEVTGPLGFMNRLKNDFAGRKEQIQPIADQAVAGDISTPEAVIRGGLKMGQFGVVDIPSEVAVSGFRALPDAIENPIRKGASNAVAYISDSPVGDLARSAVQKYEGFEQDHPIAAGRIGSVLDAGNIVAPFLPIGQGKSVAGSLVDGSETVAKKAGNIALQGANKLNTKTVIPGSDEVRKYAGDLFRKADAEGGIISAPDADDFYKQIAGLDRQTAAGGAFAGESPVKALMQRIDESGLRGQPLTFEAAKEVDEALGELAYGTMDNFGKLDANGNKFLDMQRALRDKVSGIEGGETLGQAREAWSASIRMSDIERIMARAERSEQPATTLRAGFRTLLDNAKKTKGSSPAELKALERAAETGIVTDLFRLGGSGLVPIIAGSGGAAATGGLGALAAIPAYAAQQASKKVGVSRQFSRAEDALKASTDRLGLTRQEPRIDLQKLLKMKPAEARKLLQKDK